MSKPKIVNIQRYGDFGQPYVAVSMLAPDNISKDTMRKITKLAEAISVDTDDTDVAVKYLKDWGCIVCSDYEVTVGGNL